MKRKLKRGWRWKKERSPTKVGSAVYVYTLFFLSSPSSLLIIIRCRPAWAPSFHQESLRPIYSFKLARLGRGGQTSMIRSPSLLSPYSIPHERSSATLYRHTHTHTRENWISIFFVEGKQNYLFDTPIKKVDFKFYAQILWSKNAGSCYQSWRRFSFSRRKVKFG